MDPFALRGLDSGPVVFIEFIHGDDLVTRENAVQQTAFLRARHNQAEVNVKTPNAINTNIRKKWMSRIF